MVPARRPVMALSSRADKAYDRGYSGIDDIPLAATTSCPNRSGRPKAVICQPRTALDTYQSR